MTALTNNRKLAAKLLQIKTHEICRNEKPKKKMSRRSWGTLRKKLRELESELNDAYQFRLQPHSDSDQKISRRLNKRFDYVSSLLSAEAASAPDKTYQLTQMTEKFAELEAVFRWWKKENPDTYALTNCLAYEDDNGEADSEESDSSVEDSVRGDQKGYYRRIWGRFCKLCCAFGCGMILGAVSVNYFSSLYICEYRDIYDIHPT